jgi:hypothetical protein
LSGSGSRPDAYISKKWKIFIVTFYEVQIDWGWIKKLLGCLSASGPTGYGNL